MTYAEYLAFEATSDTKHEYVNGQVYAMAGGSPEHSRLAARLARLVGNALEGRPCDVFSSDGRVRVEATGRSTYPDLTVVCGELRRAKDDPDAITNPILLVEILSESTEASDRGEKWAHYQRLASLREYVLVSQDRRNVEVFRRSSSTAWSYEAFDGPEVTLRSISATLSLDALYHDPLTGP